jgi:hypothetical protein
LIERRQILPENISIYGMEKRILKLTRSIFDFKERKKP